MARAIHVAHGVEVRDAHFWRRAAAIGMIGVRWAWIAMPAVVTVMMLMTAAPVRAANFLNAAYEARTDELVVTLSYRGTNPDHQFSIEWGECRDGSAEDMHEIAARVLDDQWDDRAREPFTTTVRFPLHDLHCRPARITLLTEPDFRISVFVPARGSDKR